MARDPSPLLLMVVLDDCYLRMAGKNCDYRLPIASCRAKGYLLDGTSGIRFEEVYIIVHEVVHALSSFGCFGGWPEFRR